MKQLPPRQSEPTITLEANRTLKDIIRLNPNRRIQVRLIGEIAVNRIKGSLRNHKHL